MNTDLLKPENWSERQQVLAIIVMGGLIMFALWYFLLLPQNRRRARMRREVSRMESELRQKDLFHGRSALRRKRDMEQEAVEKLMTEWQETAERLAAFPDQYVLAGSEVDRIDYKVALFEVRTRLLRKSRQARIGLPHDLGMTDAVTSNENSRKLLLQLRAVEKLVDLALDLQINLLQQITPLPVIEHIAEGATTPFLEEYPVRLEFFGTIENVYNKLEKILQKEDVFVLRNLRVETPAKAGSPTLRIRTTLGALVFVRSLDDVLGPLPVSKGPSLPMGY